MFNDIVLTINGIDYTFNGIVLTFNALVLTINMRRRHKKMIVRNRQYVTLKRSTLNNRGCVVPPKLDGLDYSWKFC